MSELFKNFTHRVEVTDHNEQILIPSSDNPSSNLTIDGQERAYKSIAQVHSIYVCQESNEKIKGLERYNPKSFSSFNLYIKDSEGHITYIVYDGRITPGAPFFIEKNISLDTNQMLCLSCPEDSYEYNSDDNTSNYQLNTLPNVFLNTSCSTVLLNA